MVGAASCTSRIVIVATEALPGLTNTATRTTLGTSSCRSRSRLATTSLAKKINASGVAARPGEVGDKTKLNRVFTDTEDDRDACCRSFGCKRGCGANRGDHGHLSADQVGHQCRQAIVLSLQPVVLDRHVLAFDVAGFIEAFAKPGHVARVGIGRPGSDEPDHRQRRLLRARRERPSRYTAADKCDEFPPPHGAYPKAKDHGRSIAGVGVDQWRASQQKGRPLTGLGHRSRTAVDAPSAPCSEISATDRAATIQLEPNASGPVYLRGKIGRASC